LKTSRGKPRCLVKIDTQWPVNLPALRLYLPAHVVGHGVHRARLIFIDIARVDLAAHLPVMCDFWESALLHTGSYHGNALRPHQRLHAQAALTPTHFQRWLALWSATIDQRHRGERAELAKQAATRIAGALNRRLLGCSAWEVRDRPGCDHRAP
jgi:hemoglobin